MSAELFLENTRSRMRWAADSMTNAYSRSGVPVLDEQDLRDILRFMSEAESSIQTAREYLNLYMDAADVE